MSVDKVAEVEKETGAWPGLGSVPEWGTMFLTLGTVGFAGFVGTKLQPGGRTVKPLYRRFGRLLPALENPKVTFNVNPYTCLSRDRALIFQGENKVGKTTCLAQCIPWYRRGGMPFIRPYYGLYFNGAQTAGTSDFPMWVTTQMHGMAIKGGSEVSAALEDHLAAQRFRSAASITIPILPEFLQPKPAIVIVDQLEELMKRYPHESMTWVNALTNTHVRDHQAFVILVVNSKDAIDSIKGLNQGPRWTVLTMDKPSSVPTTIDDKYFTTCDSNIGLYKQLKAEKVNGTDVQKTAHEVLGLWREQFHVPYPLLAAKSWRLLPEVELKKQLLDALEKQKVISPEDLTIVKGLVEKLEKEQILAASQKEWEVMLEEGGLNIIRMGADALPLAFKVKKMLGNKAPVARTGESKD